MKKFTTPEFAALVGCKVSLLEGLRRGKNPKLKFMPATRKKNRCYYTEEQIPEFQALFKALIVDGSAQVVTTEDVQATAPVAIAEKTYSMREFSATLAPMIDKSPENTRAILKKFKKSGAFLPAQCGEGQRKKDAYDESQIDAFLALYQPTASGAADAALIVSTDDAPVVEPTEDTVQVVTAKGFLPMTTAPHFDTIPQFCKALPRWLCWQLIPADPKPKKVPMTFKDGKLVNADVTNPDNWLNFDDAINGYNQNLCSGIGFVLCDTAPKICCVDVDHCVNPDGSLNDEAKAVIAICAESFVELSQSGGGIHVWFEDNEFPGERGRKRGNVEVYAFKRYIAMTGNHVEGTADDIKQVNGACKAVIDKFIERHSDGNLFDKPARTTEKKIIAAPVDVTLTDSDVKLIDYFRSDKCRAKDNNLFDLFNGNVDAYFKNTGKEFDDSVADCDLLLKILWYIGNDSGSDDDIGRRALGIFNASALAKREKWLSREDYRLRTLNAALDLWNQNRRRAHDDNGDSAQIKELRAKLQDVNQQLATFETEKAAALKKFNDEVLTLDAFDYKSLATDDVINAVAVARLYDPASYTCLRSMIKEARDDGEKTIDLNDFGGLTKRRAEEIKKKYDGLVARRNELQAAIRTQKFIAANQDVLAQYVIPDGYSISDNGIEKIKARGNELVCRQPVIIKGRVFDTDKQIHSLQLCYQNPSGKWRDIKPQEKATVANSRKIVELANLDFPVTSVNANAIVEFLDAFRADNELRFPMTYQVPRCGWFERHGSKVFIDPRRNCSIEAEGKHITCAVSDASEFAKHLRSKGSLDEWKKAYLLAKKSPVARFAVAASVAAPLLDIVYERNFVLYLKAKTRSGKTTAQLLAASAIGDEKIMRSFDATKNGLIGAAADVNDYAYIIDEKQSTDGRLKENLTELVYALANGVGRTKLNRDSTLKKLQDWRTIVIGSGETDLLPDNATDGADTRLLTVAAPPDFLPADDCREIRRIIADNYGHALPLVLDKILKNTDKDLLIDMSNKMGDTFAAKFDKNLAEHRRYIAVVTLADALLNSVLFGDTVILPDGSAGKPSDDAVLNAGRIFKLIPTVAEISATDREKTFVRAFVGENQNCFVGGSKGEEYMTAFYGKIPTDADNDDFVYITCKVLQDACNRAGFDYRKLVSDLVADGFFVPADNKEKDRKTPRPYVKIRINKVLIPCYRIQKQTFDAVK